MPGVVSGLVFGGLHDPEVALPDAALSVILGLDPRTHTSCRRKNSTLQFGHSQMGPRVIRGLNPGDEDDGEVAFTPENLP